MPAAKDFYVAIELGSSKITGIAGQKKMDGSINVLAIASEEASACIRKGVVYNIDKTNQCIRNIIQKLQNTLQTQILRVFVGIGGQGVRSMLNTITKDLDETTKISNAIVDVMGDTNLNTKYSGKTILDVAVQEYKVDSQFQLEPVGIECNRIEGRFQNIVWRDAFYRNLCKCFEQDNMPDPCYYLAPTALAESILSETEKRTGCMLIDLGAQTTTVSIYYKNILRHLVTIPMGGLNVTKDICAFHVDEIEAEKMKLKYAAAYTNPTDVDPDLKLPIDAQRSVPQREFISYVEAREEEIIRNAIAQIPSEYTDKLVGGVVLTGGGALMPNIELAFRKYTAVEKVRIATTINASVNVAKNITLASDAMHCTILALLMKAHQTCDGRPLSEIRTLFDDATQTAATATTKTVADNVSGKIPTGREREALEKAAREKAEEEKRQKEEEERKRKEEEERKRRENSFATRWGRKFSSILGKFTEPEE